MSVAFDDQGRIYVVEAGYSYGELFTTPQLLRIEPGGKPSVIASGGKNGPWTSVSYHQGAFLVAEGGEIEGGKILRITPAGEVRTLVEGLPSMGDHHTNSAITGPDGYIYFGQGTATNSGVVGPDNARFGWLKRKQDFHDIPCEDIVLTGQNFESEDPLAPGGSVKTSTGAFVAFKTKTAPNQKIEGRVPCNGAILRMPAAGGKLEVYAWGFRNPWRFSFDASGGALWIGDVLYLRDEEIGDPRRWDGFDRLHGRHGLTSGEFHRVVFFMQRLGPTWPWPARPGSPGGPRRCGGGRRRRTGDVWWQRSGSRPATTRASGPPPTRQRR